MSGAVWSAGIEVTCSVLRLAKTGALDESIVISQDALSHPAVDGSQRLRDTLRDTAAALARQQYRPARSFAATLPRLLPAT